MSNIAQDLGAIFGNETLSAIGNSTLGKSVGSYVSSTIKKPTPKPVAQVATVAPEVAPVNLDVSSGSMVKKVVMAGAAIFAVLVGVYYFKKGRK